MPYYVRRNRDTHGGSAWSGFDIASTTKSSQGDTMPLVATLGQTRVLAESLTEQDRGKDFRCPACKAPFRVVLPKTNVVKHFRHVTGVEHWEPETAEHLSMKTELSKMAESLGYPTILEQRIGDESDYAIADVYVDNGRNNGIAVECQCSNVQVEAFVQRDRFYKQRWIAPIWILGGRFFMHTTTRMQWKRTDKDPYEIQKISSLEKRLLQERRLFYYGQGRLYVGDFKFRWKRKIRVLAREAEFYSYDDLEDDGTGYVMLYSYNDTLGWYNLKETNLEELLAGIRST